MKGLWEAISFFTIIPLGKYEGRPGPSTLFWLPFVGGILGLIWASFDALLSPLVPWRILCILDVLVLVALTGGIHLDGLADSADGLLSHRGRDEALRIMRDSRIGTWGVIAVIFTLSLKVAALEELGNWGRFRVLALAPVYGRTAMLLGLNLLPYGRGEEGIASGMLESKRGIAHWLWLLAIVAGSFIILRSREFLVGNLVFGFTVMILLRFYSSRVGCITGDMAGAMGEISETVLLLAMALSR
jgi:adenosylcobinamide-GDP ribazoletransferase